MALIQRGKTFHAVLYKDGKQIWKTLETKDRKEANQEYFKLITKKPDTKPTHRSEWTLFSKRYMIYAETDRSESFKTDRAAVSSFHAPIMDVSDLTAEMIETWKTELKSKNKKPHTINRYLGTLKNMAAKALEWGYLTSNPLEGVKGLPIPETLKYAYSKAEIALLRKSSNSFLQTVLIETVFRTGMRRGELRRLTWEDVDFVRRWILVRAGKSKKIRFVPLHPKLKSLLLDWKKKNPGPYIMSESGQQTNQWILSKKFKKMVIRAGLKGSIHLGRHTWITKMALSGANMNLVQKWAGHENLKTTSKIYTHVRPQEGGEEINLLDY